MKITKILILLLTLSSWAYGQSDAEEVKETFYKHRKLIEQKKYDQAFDYYLEDFLKYIPKEKLNEQFTALEENKNIAHSVKNSEINFITEIMEKDGVKYCLINYGSEAHLKLNRNLPEADSKRFRNNMKERNGDNYSFSEEDNTVILYKEQELIGVKNDTWKFIPYKKKLAPFMKIWIPEDTMQGMILLSVSKRQKKE